LIGLGVGTYGDDFTLASRLKNLFVKSVTIKLDTITAPRVIQPEKTWWIRGMKWQEDRLNVSQAFHS
jgi:hypothetical protein